MGVCGAGETLRMGLKGRFEEEAHPRGKMGVPLCLRGGVRSRQGLMQRHSGAGERTMWRLAAHMEDSACYFFSQCSDYELT